MLGCPVLRRPRFLRCHRKTTLPGLLEAKTFFTATPVHLTFRKQITSLSSLFPAIPNLFAEVRHFPFIHYDQVDAAA